jgi:NADH:ubiquinone oxidoreductase subunit K
LIKLTFGSFNSHKLFSIVSISLSISKSFKQFIRLKCCMNIVNWNFIRFIKFWEKLNEKVSDFFLRIL